MNKKGHQQKKKKLKLKVNVFLRLLAFLFICVILIIYIATLKIKNIYITGTTYVTDASVIEQAGISDYPILYKLNISKMKEKIKEIPLVVDVKIKRNFFGKITIEITEDKILFFYKYNNKYITSSGDSIEDNGEYNGFATLVNFTPDTIFEDFIEGLNKVDYSIVKMISEIEYTPYKASDGTVIDNSRFTLLMNDSNTVLIDTVNIKNLNKYTTIMASPDMDSEKGIIYLDSINEERILFKSYETIEAENASSEEENEDS